MLRPFPDDTAGQRTARIKRVLREAGLADSVDRVASTEHYVKTPTMSSGELVVTSLVFLRIYTADAVAHPRRLPRRARNIAKGRLLGRAGAWSRLWR